MYNPLPNANAGNNLSICYGNDTVLSASGGTFFLWNTTETSSTINIINPLSDSTYYVTVSDVNGCSDIDSVSITVNSLPTADAGVNDTICNGDNITLTATGGTDYLWSNSATTNLITVNPSTQTTYFVTVTDGNGCKSTDNVIITVNSLPTPTIIGSLTYCIGSNAILTTENYSSYLWSNDSTTQSISADTLDNPISVTVTDSNGCIGISSSVNLTASTSLSPVISGNLSYCAGNSTVLNAGIFTNYNWSNSATTQTINVTAGTYDVTVSDASGCTGVSASVLVVENPNPSPVISGNLSYCAGSNTVLSVGTFDSYNWTTSATTQTINATIADNNPVISVVVTLGSCSAIATPVTVVENPNPTPVISGNLTYCEGTTALLDAGSFTTYTWTVGGATTQTINVTEADNPISVLVTNAFGCSALATPVNVSESLNPVPNITGSLTYCVGNNAVLNVGAFDSYSWSTGDITQAINATEANNPISVIVTNVDGCMGYDTVSVTEASSLSPVIAGDTTYCEGSNTTLDAGTYTTYDWSTTDTTQTIIATAGTYYVTVYDSFGCSGIDSVNISENSNPTPVISGTLDFCANDSTLLTTTVFSSYLWSNGSTNDSIYATVSDSLITLTVTNTYGCIGADSVVVVANSLPVAFAGVDKDICYGDSTSLTASASGAISFVWNTTDTTNSISVIPLSYTIYYVTVTNAEGCTDDDEVIVDVNDQLFASISATNVDCYGNNTGVADLTVSGGTPPYTFNWSTTATTEDISGLVAGNYDVISTDSVGCKINTSVTVTEPTSLTVTFSNIVDAICSGNTGSATADASGGITPYSYLWDSNSGNQITPTASSLGGGAHQITVTDANSCSAINSVNIISTTGGIADISSFTNNNCFGDSSGIAIAAMTGGTSPFTFSWSNTDTNDTISNLEAGVYTVTITDANNCISSDSVTITEPSEVIATISQTATSCYNGTDGTATVIVSGGTSPYTYLWSDNQTTSIATGLSPNGYFVTITDSFGCKIDTNISVNNAVDISISESQTNITCKGSNNGSIAVIANGGTSTYTYSWSSGGNTNTIINVIAGIYTVTVTDSNNCTKTKAITLTEPALNLQVNVTSVDADCFNENTGEATATVTSGVSPYTYLWSSNSQTTQIATGLLAGYHTVTITDSNGCNAIGIVNIGSPTQIEVVDSTTVITKTSCQGSTDGKIVVNYSGGIPTLTYYWNNGKTDNEITELSTGNYYLTVTDFNNCEEVDTFFVGSEPVTCLDIPTAFTPNNDSYNDTWEIKYLYLYPGASIKIFNRWGQLVYECKDGCKPWDGTHNGKPLAFGPFTYIIDLNDGTDPINGVVTLIK